MPQINGADTMYVIFCALLVMLMIPALALFYGGLVRKKNVLSTTMHSYVALAVISIQWIVLGYSLVFGNDHGGLIGGLNFLGLNGVTFAPNPDYAANIPHQAFMLFQLMFAVITPAVISGAFAERIKFSAFILFIVLWTTFVYDPLAHWVWGVGGFLRNMGALDFSGGAVVEISSGISALVAALVIGRRKNVDKPTTPHHIPMSVLGCGLLWFGWFGFNAGSALGVNSVALNALITTNSSAAAAAIAWMLFEKIHTKKVSVIGFTAGAIAGLVAITPACGYVTPAASLFIGLVSGIMCFTAVTFVKEKLRYDDTLDAFGCHGIGGIWGVIATGLFATKTINPAGADGFFYGGAHLLGVQLIMVAVTVAFTATASYIILKIVDKLVGLRVSDDVEEIGLDPVIHGVEAYSDFGDYNDSLSM